MHSKTLITCLFCVVFAVGCGSRSDNPVTNCEGDFNTTDCCTTDAQCAEHYCKTPPCTVGICLIRPGQEEGICSACSNDDHCDEDEWCDTSGTGEGKCRCCKY